jgi:heme exporter protein CcmD
MNPAEQLVFVYWAYAAAAVLAVLVVVWTWADYRAQRRQLNQLEGEHGALRDRG